MMHFHRKLCSSHALLPAFGGHGVTQTLAGVILLNSPATTDDELDEYLSLYASHRQLGSGRAGRAPTPPHPLREGPQQHCYFVCADGAYKRLRRYAHDKAVAAAEGQPPSWRQWCATSPLCDAVIGDMDSIASALRYSNRPDYALSAEQLADAHEEDAAYLSKQRGEGGAAGKGPLSDAAVLAYLRFDGDMYDTVEDVPEALVQLVHDVAHRACGPAAAADAPCDGAAVPSEESATASAMAAVEAGEQRPPLLPIACQLTTDFHKCVDLLKRLQRQFPGDFPSLELVSEQPATVSGAVDSADAPSAVDEALVERLQLGAALSPLDAVRETHAVTPNEEGVCSLVRATEAATARRMRTLTGVIAKGASGSNGDEEGGEAEGEEAAAARLDAERELTLLQETSIISGKPCATAGSNAATAPCVGDTGSPLPASVVMHTHVLPTVAVLGSLGGRLDHEMGAFSVLMQYVKDFHLVLANSTNVAFACWPDGVTTWLPMTADDAQPLTQQQQGQAAVRVRAEGTICGVIPFGHVRQLESVGLFYDMVKNRHAKCPPPFRGRARFNGVTGTEALTFAFGEVISAANVVESSPVSIDLRPLGLPTSSAATAAAEEGEEDDGEYECPVNPPTVITCNRA